MGRKSVRNTKGRIVSAAWKLFYEHGYDNTTVEEIIAESGTSKGSFYHYFEGKDALLSSLSYLFDEKYEELVECLPPEMDSFEKLIFLNQELFAMIEDRVSVDLLAQLYSSQLITRGEKHLLDRSRFYYRLLRQIMQEGQSRGELTSSRSVSELVKLYALCERALIYDWCISGGEYSLKGYARDVLSMFLQGIRCENNREKNKTGA
ncbi:MAG: TetR/AcrR family transcriptional regulator [Oscillospiraceae bacterium]|nr:TetR/AcrR family transcriptional regulator [Oscillospiraceae bacterium]